MKYLVVVILVLFVAISLVACSGVKEVPVGDAQPGGGQVALDIAGTVGDTVSEDNVSTSNETIIEEGE